MEECQRLSKEEDVPEEIRLPLRAEPDLYEQHFDTVVDMYDVLEPPRQRDLKVWNGHSAVKFLKRGFLTQICVMGAPCACELVFAEDVYNCGNRPIIDAELALDSEIDESFIIRPPQQVCQSATSHTITLRRPALLPANSPLSEYLPNEEGIFVDDDAWLFFDGLLSYSIIRDLRISVSGKNVWRTSKGTGFLLGSTL